MYGSWFPTADHPSIQLEPSSEFGPRPPYTYISLAGGYLNMMLIALSKAMKALLFEPLPHIDSIG